MAPTEKKTKAKGKAKGKGKGKKAERLAKPKRPMSAYNFFFRAERARMHTEAEGSDSKEASFEDIGRTIGQRWRAIGDEDLAKYKALAAEDSARYKQEMQAFYKDELSLMCHGKAAADGDGNEGSKSSDDGGGDQSPPAAAPPAGTLMHQVLANALLPGSAPSHPALLAGLGALQQPQPGAAALDDQIFTTLLQLQQQQASSAVPNEMVVKLILGQKASIEQRQQRLVQELNALQVRGDLLDKMLAKEVAGMMAASAGGSQIAAPPAVASAPAVAPAPAVSAAAGGGAMLGHLSQLLQLQNVNSASPAALGGVQVPLQQNVSAAPALQNLLGAGGINGFLAVPAAAPTAAAAYPVGSLAAASLVSGNATTPEDILKKLMGVGSG